MKRQSQALYAIILLVTPSFFNCREIVTTTRIHRDGSCERIVEVTSSSMGDIGSAFPVPADSSWQIGSERDKQDSSRYVYRAKKLYPAFSRLSDDYTHTSDTTMQVRLEIKVERRFRWFYIFFAYQETYKAYNPLHLVSIHDYMNDAELKRYTEGDTLTAKAKYEAWEKAALFEEIHCALLDSVRALADPELTPASLESHKQELYQALIEEEKAKESDEIVQVYEQVLHTRAAARLQTALMAIMDHLTKKIEFVSEVQGNKYVNIAVLPGLLIRSNAAKTEGNTVIWQIEPKAFLFDDFVMQAESRVVNIWMVVITVFSVIVAFIIWAWMFFQQRKRTGA